MTRDLWEGNYFSPKSLNHWNYVSSNPINYRDPSGLVDCSSWPPILNQLCDRANSGDTDAMQVIYFTVANIGKTSPLIGYKIAGNMLEYFLVGNGNNYEITNPIYRNFIVNDQNIKLHSDLLFGVFQIKDIKPAIENYSVDKIEGHYNTLNFYDWDKRPYPKDPGLIAAFGHIGIDALFKASILPTSKCKYLINITANYTIIDQYEWNKDRETTFSVPFYTFQIPHNWALALEAAEIAHEYTYIINWTSHTRFLADPSEDWSQWQQLKWWQVVW